MSSSLQNNWDLAKSLLLRFSVIFSVPLRGDDKEQVQFGLNKSGWALKDLWTLSSRSSKFRETSTKLRLFYYTVKILVPLPGDDKHRKGTRVGLSNPACDGQNCDWVGELHLQVERGVKRNLECSRLGLCVTWNGNGVESKTLCESTVRVVILWWFCGNSVVIWRTYLIG